MFCNFCGVFLEIGFQFSDAALVQPLGPICLSCIYEHDQGRRPKNPDLWTVVVHMVLCVAKTAHLMPTHVSIQTRQREKHWHGQ